jgi:hypothetical protein
MLSLPPRYLAAGVPQGPEAHPWLPSVGLQAWPDCQAVKRKKALKVLCHASRLIEWERRTRSNCWLDGRNSAKTRLSPWWMRDEGQPCPCHAGVWQQTGLFHWLRALKMFQGPLAAGLAVCRPGLLRKLSEGMMPQPPPPHGKHLAGSSAKEVSPADHWAKSENISSAVLVLWNLFWQAISLVYRHFFYKCAF